MLFKKMISLALSLVLAAGLMPALAAAQPADADAAIVLEQGESTLEALDTSTDMARVKAAGAALLELCGTVDEADYTADSWRAFASAKAAFEGVAESDDAGLQAYVDAFDALYCQFYYGLTPQGPITVHFRTMEPTYVRTKIMGIYSDSSFADYQVGAGFNGQVTLDGAYRLSDILSQLGIRVNQNDLFTVGLFVNGKFVSGYYAQENSVCGYSYYWSFYGSSTKAGSTSQKDVQLHPGDDVTLVYAPAMASTAKPTIYNTSPLFSQFVDSLRYQAFTEDSAQVEVGADLTLEVLQQPASLTVQAASSPAAGMLLYVSDRQDACGANVTATTPLAVGGEQARTDQAGRAAARFYEEGWYLVAAYDSAADVMGDRNEQTFINSPGTYYSGNTGAAMWVHVVEASSLEAVKDDLRADLDAAYGAYSEDFFAPDDWQVIQSAYDQAVGAIDAAVTAGDAARASSGACATIKSIQSKTVQANEANLFRFRNDMMQMPVDLGRLSAAYEGYVSSLVACYEGMTDYQRSLLTVKEQADYDVIAAAYAQGLPASQGFQLSATVVADSPEAEAAISNMVEYLRRNAPSYDRNFRKVCGLYEFYIQEYNMANPIEAADAHQYINFISGISYASYFLIRDAAGHSISGEGWSISDCDGLVMGQEMGNWRLYGSPEVLINGVPYEVKSVEFTGLEHETEPGPLEVNERSTFKGKTELPALLDIEDAYYGFAMPAGDVSATVTWGPVHSTDREGQLGAAYAGYSKADYSPERWSELTCAYQNGVTAIRRADDDAQANAALAAALAAMAAVEKRPAGSLGSVSVTVENTTYADAPFTGTILDGVYDLEEGDTMMTMVLKALEEEGFAWEGTGGNSADGYDITYLSKISANGESLAEFDGGGDSGWMGTLNDWFTNESFAMFGVANGKLSDGDVIRIMYTSNGLGADLGGTWDNCDTTLKGLQVAGGALSPAFDGGTHDYVLQIQGDLAVVRVTPTASNKNFLVKAFLNEKVTSNAEGNSFYRRTEGIPVKPGDVIYVGCGELAWPSMNNQFGNIQNQPGSWYTLRVMSLEGGSDEVQALIDSMPDASKVTYGNYASMAVEAQAVRNAMAALNATALEKLNVERLAAFEARVASFARVDEVRAMIDGLDVDDYGKVRAVLAAFDALSDEQRGYLTVGQTRKVQNLGPLADAQLGDANNSGKVNIVDAQIVYDLACGRYGENLEAYPLPSGWTVATLQWVCDVNAKDMPGIDAVDAFAIQRFVHYGAWS